MGTYDHHSGEHNSKGPADVLEHFVKFSIGCVCVSFSRKQVHGVYQLLKTTKKIRICSFVVLAEHKQVRGGKYGLWALLLFLLSHFVVSSAVGGSSQISHTLEL